MSIDALPSTKEYANATKIPNPPTNPPKTPSDDTVITNDEPQADHKEDIRRKTAPAWHLDFEPEVRGLRNPWWVLWWLYGACRLYKHSWVPIPHHWGFYKTRININHDRVWNLGAKVAGVYEEESVTGGVGKTSLTTWHATDMERCSDAHALIVDADSGAKGKAAIRLEIDMENQPLKFEDVHDLILNGRWEPTHDDLYTWLPRHEETGVRLLSTSSSITLTEAQMKKVIQKLRPAYSVIFIDTTPGIKENITRGARSVATVVSIPCLFASKELTHDVYTTRYHMNENKNEFDRRLDEGGLFISVNDVPKAQFNRRTQYQLAEQLNVPASQILLFPSDNHLYQKGTVTRSAVSTRFLYALSESTRLRAEANARHNEIYPLPLPSPIAKEDPARQIVRMSKSLALLCGSPQNAAAAVLKSAK